MRIRLLIASGGGRGDVVVGDSDDRPIVALLALEVTESSSVSISRPSFLPRDLYAVDIVQSGYFEFEMCGEMKKRMPW